MLSRHQLFERLAQGHAARITVVTPNRRLARALELEFDAFQQHRGLASWEAADILPFDAFVERLWQDALYSEAGEKLPQLLTPAQEQYLWERILLDSGLLVVRQAAAQCRDAWRLIHAWRIGNGPGNEDAAAFSRWAAAYRKETHADIDGARLPDLVVRHLDLARRPALVVAYAFDVLPPQTREFLSRFASEECAPPDIEGAALRTSYASAKLELEAAARWARARLEEGRTSIGVVVPDLGRRRAEVARVFSRVLHPAHGLPGQPRAPLPFNLSLGRPLTTYPLVHDALALLALAHREVDFALASHLVRSPFLGGADRELARRAGFDARLRRDAEATLTLGGLVAAAEAAPLLRERLEKVFQVAKSRPASPGDWARHFSQLLEAAGFPGERPLDSDEFQVHAKWHEALGELSRLEWLAERLSFADAHGFLERLCGETLFQPQSPPAPIQVLGLFESEGLRFDCLWVSGLTDETWPLDAHPNPFIPTALQRVAGIPQATAEGSLAFAERVTQQWLHAAREAVFSHAEREQDRALAPSPLIATLARRDIALPDYPAWRDLVFAARRLERFADARAPHVAAGKVRGGTRVLADQAACPFRAFARWRLGAEPLEEPAPGLDARDRGKLLHALMRELWTRLRSSAGLSGDLAAAIGQAATAAVRESGLQGRFAELERERLERLAREWLEVERRRSPFEVAALEEQREIRVAGLELASRIDRMDRLADGGHVLIDYKSGGFPSPRQWEGPRPDDPQLPLYAVSAPEELGAIAFARLKPGEMKFMGYSRAEHLLPNVLVYRDWQALLAKWRAEAEALGAAFAVGRAEVDPKEALKTCRRCDLHTLCRVYEKKNPLTE